MAYGHDMPPHVDASEDVSPREDDKPPEKHKTLLETPNPPTSQKSASKSSGGRKRRESQILTLVSKHVFDLCLI